MGFTQKNKVDLRINSEEDDNKWTQSRAINRNNANWKKSNHNASECPKPTSKTVEIVPPKVNSNKSPIDLCNTQDVIHESPPLPHPQDIIAHSPPVIKTKANSPPVRSISVVTMPLDNSSTSISSGSKRSAVGRLHRHSTKSFPRFVPKYYTDDPIENRKANKKKLRNKKHRHKKKIEKI